MRKLKDENVVHYMQLYICCKYIWMNMQFFASLYRIKRFCKHAIYRNLGTTVQGVYYCWYINFRLSKLMLGKRCKRAFTKLPS